MTEDFVTYDLAVKLKEKGFNEPCYGYYHLNGGDDSFELCGNDSFDFLNSLNRFRIAAPFISHVLKWLREMNIEVVASFSYRDRVWGYQVGDMTLSEDSILSYDYSFPTYEQAALAGIEYILNNLI